MMGEPAFGEFLTIRELIEVGGLELSLVAGAQGQDRRIEAVYIGDLEDPTPWMVANSLLLTTGPTFLSDPEAAPRLVRLLKASGMVGVAVAITPHVDVIPKAMIDAGNEIGLPVIEVPPQTPFRMITSYVFNALTSRDMHRLRRSLALQGQLLQILLAEQGIEGLVRRLAEYIEGDTMLFDSHGNVLALSSWTPAAADPSMPGKVWEEYRAVSASGAPRSILDVGDWRASFREASVEGAVERILVAVQPITSVASEFAEATLTFAQRLIEVELNTTRNVAGVRRRTRAGVLEMLVNGRGTAMELGERLLSHGIIPAQPWRILVVSATPSRKAPPGWDAKEAFLDETLSAVDGILEERGVPFLSMKSQDQILVLSPLRDDEEGATDDRTLLGRIAADLAKRLHLVRVRVGASEPMVTADGAPLALAHARQCLEEAEHGSTRRGDVVLYEDLGLRAVALARLPDDLLRHFADQVVGRLQAVDKAEGSDLLHTLERYLAHSCSMSATADELYLHRNTLRNRLHRIEEVLDLDLAATGDVVEAYLGLHAAEVLRARKK